RGHDGGGVVHAGHAGDRVRPRELVRLLRRSLRVGEVERDEPVGLGLLEGAGQLGRDRELDTQAARRLHERRGAIGGGRKEQQQAIRSMTTASCTSISSTRPPCRATIGLTCASNSSATRSYRVSSSAPPAATGAAGFGATAGRAPASAARIAPPTALPIACHGAALRLTTVTRLPDTMTSATSAPGIAKIASTNGE